MMVDGDNNNDDGDGDGDDDDDDDDDDGDDDDVWWCATHRDSTFFVPCVVACQFPQ